MVRVGLAAVLALVLFSLLALPRPTIIPAPAASSGESDPLAGGVPVASAPAGVAMTDWPPTPSPKATPVPVASSKAIPVATSVSGIASWYAWHVGEAAAGPALRRFLGAHWRGTVVRVCAAECVRVRLTDWCGCPFGRIIDLDTRSFAVLAPISRGLVEVRVVEAR
jgi:rare lipoprotein A (peptidoglycan hydrolase)